MVQPTAAVLRHPAWLEPCLPPSSCAPVGSCWADAGQQESPRAAHGCGAPPSGLAGAACPLVLSLLLPSTAGISSLLSDPFGGSHLDSALTESSWTCCGMEQSQFSPKSPFRVWGRNKHVQEQSHLNLDNWQPYV